MPKTATVDDKRDLILEHEQIFARRLAYQVVDKPPLHVWMILIPFIFVIHFFRLHQAKEGRRKFTEGYMISRRHALDAVWVALREKNAPGKPWKRPPKELVDRLCEASAVHKKAMPEYRAFIELLARHYHDLMRAKGETYEDLVRAVYGSRTNYLLFLNRLNTAERGLNKAIRPHLSEEVEAAREVVASMEKSMVEIRRKQANEIFA